uniref:P/Homo B domain-containing protein n=1 Tax=Macrostomum lignano TaxID=282301 RepID=A0A1I8HWM5_9PLAT
GRNGLGNIFVWASGNGGHKSDSCACDGYTNSVYTLSVSSITQRNSKPWYLEECASTLAATYSSGGHNDKQVVTTDLRGQCTSTHTGTSASAPIAAAIVALVLQANSNLTWRDVQHITVVGANSGDFLFDAEWLRNQAGLRHSRRYGFGLMSAARMVALARLWARQVPQMLRCQCDPVVANQQVPVQGALSISVVVSSGGCSCNGGKGKTVRVLESVQLHLDASYSNRGQLQVTLISPGGTKSMLLTPRLYDNHNGDCGFQAWPLMSVQFWRESPIGKWQILVENRGSPSNHGRVATATLVLYGTEAEPIQLRRPNPPMPDWLLPWSSVMLSEPGGSIGCHRLCADNDNCTGSGPDHCHQCRHFYRSSGDGVGGVCVESCRTDDGEYADTANRICRPCHSACRVCRGPGNTVGNKRGGDCLACRSHAVSLLGNSSSIETAADLVACMPAGSICPARYYSVATTGVDKLSAAACAPCPVGCAACSGFNGASRTASRLRANCSSCQPGYLLLEPSGVCYAGRDCPMGHWLASSGVCLACSDSECRLCSSIFDKNNAECLSCRAPLMLSRSDGRCIDPVANAVSCPSEFDGCSMCLPDVGICGLCQPDRFMDFSDGLDGANGANGRCLKECPAERPYACQVSFGNSMVSGQCFALPCSRLSHLFRSRS